MRLAYFRYTSQLIYVEKHFEATILCLFTCFFNCFQNGQVASNTDADVKTIRGDKITWVKGTETHCQTIGFLINQVSLFLLV